MGELSGKVVIVTGGSRGIGAAAAAALAEAIRAAGHKNVVYCSTLQESIERLLREVRAEDAVLTIGAGNVNRALGEFALLLGSQHFMPSRHESER